MQNIDLNAAQLAAVERFAAEHGRDWRAKLCALWQSGRDEGLLRQLRNQLGERGLRRVRLAGEGAR